MHVLDTTYADAPAVPVAEASGLVEPGPGPLQTIDVDTEPPEGRDLRVRAHVDVDGDGTVSLGDFVTTAAYPVPPGDEPVRVVVSRIS